MCRLARLLFVSFEYTTYDGQLLLHPTSYSKYLTSCMYEYMMYMYMYMQVNRFTTVLGGGAWRAKLQLGLRCRGSHRPRAFIQSAAWRVEIFWRAGENVQSLQSWW